MPTLFALTPHVTDLEAFRAVCRRRGWEFRAGQRTFRWFSRILDDRPLPPGMGEDAPGKCAHAVGVPGCRYEIGLIERGLHFTPVWDDGLEDRLHAALGANGAAMWQAYVSEKIRREAARRGHVVSRFRDQWDAVRLRIVTGLPGQAAHLWVKPDASVRLWDLAADADTFRYLIDALGAARPLETIHPTQLSAAP